MKCGGRSCANAVKDNQDEDEDEEARGLAEMLPELSALVALGSRIKCAHDRRPTVDFEEYTNLFRWRAFSAVVKEDFGDIVARFRCFLTGSSLVEEDRGFPYVLFNIGAG